MRSEKVLLSLAPVSGNLQTFEECFYSCRSRRYCVRRQLSDYAL